MYNVSSVINKTSGYLACYGMDKNTYWQNAGDRITFTPYWITLDGVKVAPQTRTAEYYGPGSDADDTVTLTAANSNQHVWFAYTQSFNVAHVQFDETETTAVVKETTTHTVELFNLTSVVSNGFIYGGAFSDAACEAVQTFAEGQNATAFTPTAGATYYIWEADAQFLSPRNLSCWNHVSAADVDVTGFYLVTPVDRLNYREVGFMVGSETLPAKQFT